METLEDTDLQLWLAELDEFECSDERHPYGESFHTSGARGEFVILNPCCSDRGIICRSRAAYLKYQAAEIVCHKCKQKWPTSVYRFIPLPGVLPL